jgi:hypothetical protein
MEGCRVYRASVEIHGSVRWNSATTRESDKSFWGELYRYLFIKIDARLTIIRNKQTKEKRVEGRIVNFNFTTVHQNPALGELSAIASGSRIALIRHVLR